LLPIVLPDKRARYVATPAAGDLAALLELRMPAMDEDLRYRIIDAFLRHARSSGPFTSSQRTVVDWTPWFLDYANRCWTAHRMRQ
jgi:hypothetical protein